MVLHSTFPTEIWVENDHKCKVDNESLAKIIINKSRTEPSRELSNVGGWQSNDDLSITEELLARGTTATGGQDSFEGYPELEELLTRVGRPKGTSPISSKHTNWHTVENEKTTEHVAVKVIMHDSMQGWLAENGDGDYQWSREHKQEKDPTEIEYWKFIKKAGT